MTEAELRSLLADPAPGEADAGARAWAVVQAAYGTRERVPWIERHSRAVLALVAAVALGVAAATPPGRALVERVREAAGVTPSEPALAPRTSPSRPPAFRRRQPLAGHLPRSPVTSEMTHRWVSMPCV